MALAHQGLPVPSEDELVTQANMQSEGMDFTELQRLAPQRAAFLALIQKSRPAKPDGPSLLEDLEDFHRESLEGRYYEPFDINSKNFTNIPEGTDEWYDRIADLLKQATQLSSQGDHDWAVKRFYLRFDLIEKMEYGEEIVFADEMGSWMIPIDDKNWIPAYMTSLAATAKPGEFAAKALPVIRRDSGHSFSGAAYSSARRAASKEQKTPGYGQRCPPRRRPSQDDFPDSGPDGRSSPEMSPCSSKATKRFPPAGVSIRRRSAPSSVTR